MTDESGAYLPGTATSEVHVAVGGNLSSASTRTHFVAEGYPCWCGTVHQPAFTVMVDALKERIAALEEALVRFLRTVPTQVHHFATPLVCDDTCPACVIDHALTLVEFTEEGR